MRSTHHAPLSHAATDMAQGLRSAPYNSLSGYGAPASLIRTTVSLLPWLFQQPNKTCLFKMMVCRQCFHGATLLHDDKTRTIDQAPRFILSLLE